MGACDKFEGMDKAAYGDHVHELAKKLRDEVAIKAAQTVMERAQGVQGAARIAVDNKAMQDAAMAGQDIPQPGTTPLPPDRGYHLLPPDWKKFVDDYKEWYSVDLLTFDSKNQEDAYVELRENHLTWIVDTFDRARNFPEITLIPPVVTKYEALAGTGNLADISFNPDSDDPVVLHEGAKDGQGKFGSPAFNYVGVMATSVEGWDAATADSFRERFVPFIAPAADNQKGVVRCLQNLLAVNEGTFKWGRHDIDELLHDGITAVQHFEDYKTGDDDMTVALGLIGGLSAIITGIVTMPVTGGLSAAAVGAGLSILGGTAASFQTMATMKKTELALAGETIDEVMDKITQAAQDVFGKLDEFNEALQKGFENLNELMTNEKVLYRAPAPEQRFLDADEDNVRDVVESDTD